MEIGDGFYEGDQHVRYTSLTPSPQPTKGGMSHHTHQTAHQHKPYAGFNSFAVRATLEKR